MNDIIERAQAALEGRWPGERIISSARFFGGLVRELVAELKAARSEAAAWRENAEHYEWSADEVRRLNAALHAAQADNERLEEVLLSLCDSSRDLREVHQMLRNTVKRLRGEAKDDSVPQCPGTELGP